MSPASSWTSPDELVSTLRRRWTRGGYLRAHAHGDPWEPVAVALNGPKADDLLRDPAAVAGWVDAFRRAAVDRRGRERFVIEHRIVRSRTLGDNLVPRRIRVDTLQQLADLLGTTNEIERLDQLLATTRTALPGAVAWVADHPLEALSYFDDWHRLLAVACWIVDHEHGALDLRHLDVAGVDTKFVERHRKILSRLLDEVLPVGRVDPAANDFARKYGFRPRPRYVRLRLLSPVPSVPEQLTELELRADELAQLPLPARTVFVVENRASYLAFPEVRDSIVLFGGGFAVTTLELVPWLAEREVVYWGDIDTHGFAILDRLRQRVPTTRSVLMDRPTLLDHRDQLTTEPTPTKAHLDHLTADEAALYRDLIEDRYGRAIRLEQERVRFGLIRDALAGWQTGTTTS
jgi:hypothetical protein